MSLQLDSFPEDSFICETGSPRNTPKIVTESLAVCYKGTAMYLHNIELGLRVHIQSAAEDFHHPETR